MRFANIKAGAALAGISAIAGVAAITGGTYSYFSDSNPSVTSSEVTMGTLSLNAGLNDAQYPVTISNAEPGQTIQSGSLAFHNAGSIDGALEIKVVPDAGNSAAFNDDVVLTLEGVGYYQDPAGLGTGATLSVAATQTANWYLVSPMFAGRYKNFSYSVSISPSAGNDIQGQTGGFTVEAELVQAHSYTHKDGTVTLGAVPDSGPVFPGQSTP